MCPAKTQISLDIRPVWSEYSLCAQRVAKDLSFLHADSEDWSDWADLSLLWALRSFCWFCHAVAQNAEAMSILSLFWACYIHLTLLFWASQDLGTKESKRGVNYNIRVMSEKKSSMIALIFEHERFPARVFHNWCLTHISLASHLWEICKQCRPRSDAAERGVWSGSTLFAHRNFYQKYDKNEKSTPDNPKRQNGLVQLIRMGKSIRQMWVKRQQNPHHRCNQSPGNISTRWQCLSMANGNGTLLEILPSSCSNGEISSQTAHLTQAYTNQALMFA